MTGNETLNALSTILMQYVKSVVEKDSKATSDGELKAMTEAANTIVQIEVIKINLL